MYTKKKKFAFKKKPGTLKRVFHFLNLNRSYLCVHTLLFAECGSAVHCFACRKNLIIPLPIRDLMSIAKTYSEQWNYMTSQSFDYLLR